MAQVSLFDADVVLLHGFMGVPWTMRPMGRALRQNGLQPFCPWYESWTQPFDAIVDRICAQLAPRAFGTQRPLHVVGHSMGGLVARAVIERMRFPQLGRVVMIGTPHGGSELADFCVASYVLRPMLGRAAATLVTERTLPALANLGPPPCPLGIIASNRPRTRLLNILPAPHDGRVSVAATHWEGETDHIVLPVPHGTMPYDRAIQRETLHFLQNGRFSR